VIHQPRTTIFDLFDGLLLLSKGEEVYSGRADGARRVLESCPIIGTPLPEQTNIADWIMDTIIKDENKAKPSSSVKDEESPLADRVLPNHWSHTKSLETGETGENSKIIDNDSIHKLVSLAEIQNSAPKYTAPFGTQLRMLMKRAIKQNRGENITHASIIATLFYVAFESLFGSDFRSILITFMREIL